MAGQIQNPSRPELDLTLSAMPARLSEMRLALPDWRDKIPKGEARGKLRVRGPLEIDKEWHDWPLSVSGEVAALVPEFVMPPPEPGKVVDATAAASAGAAPTQTDSLLPSGRLTKALQIKVSASIERFQKEDLNLAGLRVQGVVNQGAFRGQVDIGEIFAGRLNVKNLDVPLLHKRPLVQGEAAWGGLVLQDVIGFLQPEYKTFASGKLAGRSTFKTFLPGEPAFWQGLQAKGDFVAEPVTLNSVKVGEMVNSLVGKVPVLKLNPVKLTPLNGSARASYELRGGVFELPSFVARDVDNSEIQLKGKVALPGLDGDLIGTFYWATPQVKGCLLEGNSDSQGRMAIPIAVRGNLMNPQTALVTDLAVKLAGRALECESKKLVDKVRKSGSDAVQKEINKALKGILGN
ncbi:MAG: hypothetical protein HC902_14265 [Calothrix sp. SM1_5_4]|nr:hypothetical protein [Calothrix sp. SM1_5_4]